MKCIKIIFFLFLKLIYQNNLKQKKINQKNFELLRNASIPKQSLSYLTLTILFTLKTIFFSR